MKPSRSYHEFTSYHREPGGLRRLDFFVDRIQAWANGRPPESIRVLDVGCGNGNISLPLAALGYRVTGIDLEAEAIERARRSAEDLTITSVTFEVGSLEKVSDRTFDVLIVSEVLEHVKETASFLNDLRARLSPEGILLLSVPNGQSLEERIRKITTKTTWGFAIKRWIKKRISHQDIQSAASHPHEQFFSWKRLSETLYANGWSIYASVGAAAWFKEFFYLFGRFFVKRGSAAFHACDAIDGRMTPALPISIADGWLIESRSFDVTRPLVMHVVPTLEAGGAERLVYELARRLPVHGFRTDVISILRGGALEELFAHSHVRHSILNLRGFLGISATCELYRRMRRDRPMVVHTHLFGADVWGRVAAKFAGVPIVISTEHNVNTDHGIIKESVKGALARWTTAYIAVSDEVKRYMVKQDHVPASLVHVVPNGIDISRVVIREPRAFRDVPRLLNIARLEPQKGHDVLLKALALVKKPWTLDLVGTGTLEADLRALADRLGIAPRIHWLGYRNDVPELLAASDLFCFPSRWEGLGIALLEAASAGVPVVASDLPALHEVLRDDEAAYVRAGDVPALAHAIEGVLTRPFPAIERASHASVRVRQEFSIERMTSAYAGLYHSLITRKR